jgi:hypothetical protein
MPSIKQILFPNHNKAFFSKLQKHFQHHACDKTIEWNWESINYNRIALVNLLTSKYTNCDYLEIGCNTNNLFDSVPVKNKVGVDPFAGGNIRKTSDDFFKENNAKFDVIFIDGLHTYEQVRLDVINAIKALKPGGWIALHDNLPRDWIEQHVPVVSPTYWTGDVWKVAFELAKTVGIDFKILKIDYGVGVFKLNASAPQLVDLTAELSDKQFSYFYENLSQLPILEWEEAQSWLRT